MIPILVYSFIYLGLFALTDLLYYRFSVSADTTRKIAHIVSGLIALSFPIYFDEIWQVVVITVSFLILLVLSEQQGWFKSITAVKRKSWGSWLFPLAILICFVTMKMMNDHRYYTIPMLVLTISDTLASLLGRKFPWGKYQIFGHTKTLMGSMAFFISSFLIFESTFDTNTFFEAFVFALAITLVEAFSYKGVDNLTIPLSCIILLYLLI